MNIGVISSIEYLNNQRQYTAMAFRKGSAAFECKPQKTDAGTLYKHKVTFKVSKFDTENNSNISQLLDTSQIRFTDVNGFAFVLGSNDINLVILCGDSIDGSAGSFRGHEISVQWDVPVRAVCESFK